MIKNILRITLISYIWQRYKIIIVSTLLLFVYFWLIDKLHQDFISYSHLISSDKNLGLSFLLKWFCLLIGVVVYFFLNSRRYKLGKHQKKASNMPGDSADRPATPNKADPFQAIREKARLRSKADITIEKNNK